MFRTHTCGELNEHYINQEVLLSGWIQSIRDKGFIVYIDIRDQYGITQLILDKHRTDKNVWNFSKTLGREFVIQAKGIVIKRQQENIKHYTGKIEILVSKLLLLNSSKVPPFYIQDDIYIKEELRMKFRYLDIRRDIIKNKLIFRNTINQKIRNFFLKKKFLEIETPILIKSTPEGARDFIVPSRLNLNQFYALPQSPQIFKQLLMISGLDKYFQIAKCFRDEDFRSDRQIEFTQIDAEMSFVNQNDILKMFQKLILKLIFEIKGIKLKKIPIMTYNQAIKLYGTDKPDLRFDMKFVELNKLLKTKKSIFNTSELIIGINIKHNSNFSNKKINNFIKSIQISNENKLFCIKINESGEIKSSLDKFLSKKKINQIINKFKGEKKDLILILSGNAHKVRLELSSIRLKIAKKFYLIDHKKIFPIWIIDFPLFKYNNLNNRYISVHHPFTSPKKEDIHYLINNPLKVRSDSYDLVINGIEIGGGSIRIHDKEIQLKIFNLLGLTNTEIKEKFGFFIEAFKYGAPPHGGIALGFDRLVAILYGEDTIRDFIPFPKNSYGRDSMIGAPSKISKTQLNELNLILKKILIN